jgi:hypothetical protein
MTRFAKLVISSAGEWISEVYPLSLLEAQSRDRAVIMVQDEKTGYVYFMSNTKWIDWFMWRLFVGTFPIGSGQSHGRPN